MVLDQPVADAAIAPIEEPGGEAGDLSVLALPPSASDAALIAWAGTGTEPATKVTLQQALTGAAPGSTVQVVPLSTGYRFASILTVPESVTLTAATATMIYGRLTVSGGGLAATNVSFSPAANGQTAVTVSASGALVSDLLVHNPEAFTGTTGIAVAAGPTGVTVQRATIDGTATGINLGTSSSTSVLQSSITRVTTGILCTGTASATGPTINGTTITFTSRGVLLGATAGAQLLASTLTGPGAGTTYGVDYQSATSVMISDPTISGVLHGISTSLTTTAGAGITVVGGSVTATGTGIGLAATTGASVTGTALTRIEPTNNAAAIGVNILNASDVTLTDVTATGFREGVLVAPGNTAPGLSISGGRIAAVVSGVALGASTAPSVTDVVFDGQLRPAATAIATVAIELAASTSASISGITANSVARGVNAPVTNTAIGPDIRDSTISLAAVAAATGVNLGATEGAVVDSVTVTGTSRGISRTTGITTNRARSATISDVTVSGVATGIGATWERLSGRSIPGHEISGADISDVSIGVYTANTTGTTVRDSVIDAWGEGVAGHEDADFSLLRTTVTGHTGSTFQNGTNCIRFYYTEGMTVVDVTTRGGATGLYLDMSSDAHVSRIDVSAATWYGTYAESITGYTLRDSVFHDNAGIGNLTINPTSLDAIDQRMVSSGILFETSSFTDNLAGLYLPMGAYDIVFRDNTVRGTSTYVMYGAPVHDVTFQNNTIDYTHDPSLTARAEELASAPRIAEPLPDPPLPDTPPEEGPMDPAPASLDARPFIVAPMSPTPPATANAAVWIAPAWFDLDTDTASSSQIRVQGNVFTGDGPFVGVGTNSTLDRGTPDAPTDPSAMRTVRDTIDVSFNVFPRDSTAIVTTDNAEIGLDGNSDNTMINGTAAVDARGDNDWGSPCYSRVPTDGYDGGGAYIHELRTTQVLYPQACAPGPGPDPDQAGSLARSGTDLPTTLLAAIATAGIALGCGLLWLRRRDQQAVSKLKDPAGPLM